MKNAKIQTKKKILIRFNNLVDQKVAIQDLILVVILEAIQEVTQAQEAKDRK